MKKSIVATKQSNVSNLERERERERKSEIGLANSSFGERTHSIFSMVQYLRLFPDDLATTSAQLDCIHCIAPRARLHCRTRNPASR